MFGFLEHHPSFIWQGNNNVALDFLSPTNQILKLHLRAPKI